MARTIAAVGCRAFEPIVVPIAFAASFAPTTNRNHTAARVPTLATNAAVPFIATGDNVVTPCPTNNKSSRYEDFWVQTQRIYRLGKCFGERHWSVRVKRQFFMNISLATNNKLFDTT
jgi:hypothetical protein